MSKVFLYIFWMLNTQCSLLAGSSWFKTSTNLKMTFMLKLFPTHTTLECANACMRDTMTIYWKWRTQCLLADTTTLRVFWNVSMSLHTMLLQLALVFESLKANITHPVHRYRMHSHVSPEWGWLSELLIAVFTLVVEFAVDELMVL